MIELTVEQAAILQGFPGDWTGRKTSRYRQVANVMPPPLARALGLAVDGFLDRAMLVGDQTGEVLVAVAGGIAAIGWIGEPGG